MPAPRAVLPLSLAVLTACSLTVPLERDVSRVAPPPVPALPHLVDERDERVAARPEVARAGAAVADAAGPGIPASLAAPGAPLRMGLADRRLGLPAGRSVVEVELPPARLVSIAVFGQPDALLSFDLTDAPLAASVQAHRALDEDGVLPRVTSFRSPPLGGAITVIVEVAAPATLARVDVDPTLAAAPSSRALKLGQADPRPLIGFPTPASRDDGYILQSPARYQFMRVDVALQLLAAIKQTRVRFRRDPIAIADVTQWDGVRPATDLGRPRHISHEGGRDVDIALPANDGEPSTVRAHCTSVLVASDVQGCAPGTARGVDALRLAYLLGLLVDGTPSLSVDGRPSGAQAPQYVEKIFTDDVYVREIRKAAEVLRERRWIKDAGYAALSEDGLVRASPWHTDHVHVRFVGEPGRPVW